MPQRGTKISVWNTRGMSAAIPYLGKLLSETDILCISENWLHNNRLNLFNEISAQFHSIARSSKSSKNESYRPRRGQGGVAILWRKSLTGITPINDLHDRFCGIRIEANKNCILNILSVYLPDTSSNDDFCTVLYELSSTIEGFWDNTQTIICGDLNGNVGSAFGKRGDTTPNKQGEPYWNSELSDLKKRKIYLYKIWKMRAVLETMRTQPFVIIKSQRKSLCGL